MSSAKPPTGRRQVPVTNCSSRILFSLSISFTTCDDSTPGVGPPSPPHPDGPGHHPAVLLLPRSPHAPGHPCLPQPHAGDGGAGAHLPEPLDLLAVLGVVPVDGVLLPVVHVDLLHAAQHQLGTGHSQQGHRNKAPRPHITAPTASVRGCARHRLQHRAREESLASDEKFPTNGPYKQPCKPATGWMYRADGQSPRLEGAEPVHPSSTRQPAAGWEPRCPCAPHPSAGTSSPPAPSRRSTAATRAAPPR